MEQQTNLLNEFQDSNYKLAGAGLRFLNYLIDVIAFYVLSMIFGVFIGISFTGSIMLDEFEGGIFQWITFFFYFLIMFLYYTLLEGSKGKTLGKLLTRTKVVNEDLGPITFKQALLRTLCRFVPFEAFSAFFGVKMWHDSWTNTMVIIDR